LEDDAMEAAMNMMIAIGQGQAETQVDAIRSEYGPMIAARILEAEAADFLWEARVRERYLAHHIDGFCGDADASEDLSRVAFLSLFDGKWYAGICLVDGDGAAAELLWKRGFETFLEAEPGFLRAR
jgi:hypothetical protein